MDKTEGPGAPWELALKRGISILIVSLVTLVACSGNPEPTRQVNEDTNAKTVEQIPKTLANFSLTPTTQVVPSETLSPVKAVHTGLEYIWLGPHV